MSMFQDFSTWIKNRVADYDFVENQDFIKLHKKMELQMAVMLPEKNTTSRLIWQKNWQWLNRQTTNMTKNFVG